MASELKVNKITPESGVTLTLGDLGDTINFGSGVLPNFENLTVTGDLTVDTNSLKVDSTNNFVGIGTASPTVALDVVGAITATGNITGTLATAAQPNITSLGTLTGLTTTGDINFGDNDKAQFGAGNDLQIYHDGAQSIIDDAGTGELKIRSNILRTMKYTGETTALFTADGAVTLYYDNAEKLATTSTGIDVTGNASADIINIYNASEQGRLNVSNNGAEQLEVFPGDVSNKVTLQAFNRSTVASSSFRYLASTHEFTAGGSERMRIDSSGRVGIGTSSPAQILQATDADGTGFVGIRTQNNNVNVGLAGIEFSSDPTYSKAAIAQVRENANGNGPLLFFVDSATDAANWSTGDEKMRITSDGNVGIGTSSPSTALDVNGTVTATAFSGQGSATAYVHFNGTGTLAVNESYNVSSVTDNSTGDYTVNFSITMSSSNFPCTALCGDLSSGSTTALISQTTTSVRIRTISNDTGVGLQDPVRVAVVIFGELA
jgi:hypothetical protein